MAWNDRLLQATYISPSGIPFIFQYENVSRQSEKKTATFIFPEVDGAYIQDLGRAGRRYPFVIYFSGPEHDFAADSFMSALEQKGIGTLIHPRYGVKFVIPTGTITQRDDLVTGANQTIFSITFSETLIGLTFPESIENIISQIKVGISLFQEVASLEFATNIFLNTASEILSVKIKFENQRIKTENELLNIARSTNEIFSSFQIVNNSLKSSIDNINEIPEETANQSILLMRIPSITENININDKINKYENIINDEINIIYELLKIEENENKNNYFSAVIQSYSALISICEAITITEFNNRNEVIEISEKILDIYDNIKTWQDDNITELQIINTGETYEAVINIISLISIYLIDLSFDLPTEKKLILGEDRNIIELVSEIYGDLNMLDYFINTNNLTADEIEILPQGKEIIYYG